MNDKLNFTNYRRNGWWYGGKITKKNFDEVVEFIKRCTDGPVSIDHGRFEIKYQPHILKDNTVTAKLGDYVVRDVGGGFGAVLALNKREFKSQFTLQQQFGPLRFYTPTEVEYNVLRSIYESDTDCFYPYDWIMDYTKVDRKETKKAVDNLRVLGVVSFLNGLMNDDGEVAGSGFGFEGMVQELMAELLISRYEKRNDA